MKLSKSAQNFTSLIFSNFAVQGLRFLTISLLARRLGTEIFGAYNYIQLLISYAFILVEFGFRNFGIREFAQGRGSNKIVSHIFRIRLALSVLCCLIIVLLTAHTFKSVDYRLPALLLSFSLIADAFLLDFIVVAREKLMMLSFSNVMQTLFLFVYVIFYVHEPKDLIGLAVAFSLSHVLWATLNFIFACPITLTTVTSSSTAHIASREEHENFAGQTQKLNIEVSSTNEDVFSKKLNSQNEAAVSNKLKTVIWGGLPFLIAQLIGTIQLSLDLFLLGQFHFDQILGDYGAALKILGISLGVVHAFAGTIQPRLARLASHFESPELKAAVSDGTRMIWFIVGPTLVLTFFAGTDLVYIFFGEKYVLASRFLFPLSFVMAAFCLGQMPMQAIFVSGRTKLLLTLVLSGFTITFFALLFPLTLGQPNFVPWVMAIAMLTYVLIIWRNFGIKNILVTEDFRYVFPALTMMSLALMLSASMPKIAHVGTGVLSYFASLALLKVWKSPALVKMFGGSQVPR